MLNRNRTFVNNQNVNYYRNINKNNELDKKEGVLLITIYVIYILFAILV